MAATKHRRYPRGVVVSTWSSDTDYTTAYSYLRPGGTPADRDLLGEPIAPGLYLAGEATWSAHPGTLHGAWFSGQRAAEHVLAADGAATSRVIVVGAGMSGLAAAQQLVAKGREVVVLEAGSVAGGRAGTDRSLGGPVHLGAAWLHGDEGNPVADLVARAGIPTAPSRWGDSPTFVAGHGMVDRSSLQKVFEARRQVDDEIERAQAVASTDDALGPLVHRLIDELAPGDGIDHLILDNWVQGLYENLYAAPVDDLSLVYCDEPFRLPGRDLTLLGGLDGAVALAAENLDLRLNQRVVAIRARAQGWRVATDTAELDASAVVVTAPVGVLRAGRIAFDPPLPARVVQALARIGAGLITRASFAFDDAFWAPTWSFWIVDRPRAALPLWIDASQLAGRPVLCALATGQRGRDIELMPHAQLLELAWTTLDRAGVIESAG
jgi:polyamine oxidase